MIEWHVITEIGTREIGRIKLTAEADANKLFDRIGGLYIADTKYGVGHVGISPNEAWVIKQPDGRTMKIWLRRIVIE